jgi:1,6-anhydro-N-acetylmuramate kinase
MELVLRLALGLGAPLSARDAQTLLPLVAETLEANARAEASASSNRFRGGGDRAAALKLARLADLMAMLPGTCSAEEGLWKFKSHEGS